MPRPRSNKKIITGNISGIKDRLSHLSSLLERRSGVRINKEIRKETVGIIFYYWRLK